MFYIENENTDAVAYKPPQGEMVSPKFSGLNFELALPFRTWGEASEASQNFGPDWNVVEY